MSSEEHDALGEWFEDAINRAASERAQLAEKVSFLVAENAQLKEYISMLEGRIDKPFDLMLSPSKNTSSLRTLKLNFSLPEDQGKV